MRQREYLISLYEEYKLLLTKKQREYFESYYFEDLSFNEISNVFEVSKSFVGKTIKSIENKLELFEKKLKKNYKTTQIKKIVQGIKDEKIKRQIEEVLYK